MKNRSFLLICILISWFGSMAPGVLASPSDATNKRGDYFISTDTVIIGCTAGAAAGLLAGGIPLADALRTGIALSPSFSLLIYLTWMGCGVGAASGVVAVITAWLLPTHD